MPPIPDVQFPVTDPVIVFAIVLFVIFLAPLLLKKLNMPGMIGIILAGTALGPTGFHVLERSFAIELFGTVGLLYIMFQAGLEIDLNDFRKTRDKSLVFGGLSFFFPQVFGTLGAVYLLGLDWPAAILLASMFASHTLVAYPAVSRLDLSRNEAVTITLGGTLIVNVLALLVLAVIASSAQGEIGPAFWSNLVISFSVFVFLVLWGGPRLVRWFFRSVESEGASQYIFVLSFVFAASFGAKLAGVEAIIGAFLAGLAINRLVPSTSPLMNRIDFVGNALFIPFFLINVGMLVDLGVLMGKGEALLAAGIVVTLSVLLKWLPAAITTRLFRYRPEEGRIIFGLSVAQAASTLAAALIGFDLGLISETILNGIIVMILVTCMLSSFLVESAGKKLAILEAEKTPDLSVRGDRILVPIANPANIFPLIDLAVMIKKPKSTEPVYPLSIIPDDSEAQERILLTQKALEKAVKHAAASGTVLEPITRVDLHPGGGIVRAVKEVMATRIIVGWHGRYNPKDFLFGTVLDYLLTHTNKMIFVTRLLHPLNTVKKIVVAVPDNAAFEPGFHDWINTIHTLAVQISGDIHFFGQASLLTTIGQIFEKTKPVVRIVTHPFDEWDDFLILAREVTPHDLFVVVKARPGSLSHQSWMDKVPRYLGKHFQENSFIVLYPEQVTG